MKDVDRRGDTVTVLVPRNCVPREVVCQGTFSSLLLPDRKNSFFPLQLTPGRIDNHIRLMPSPLNLPYTETLPHGGLWLHKHSKRLEIQQVYCSRILITCSCCTYKYFGSNKTHTRERLSMSRNKIILFFGESDMEKKNVGAPTFHDGVASLLHCLLPEISQNYYENK